MKNFQELREALLSLPMPTADQPGRFASVELELKLRLKMASPDNARVCDGVAYWNSNDAPIPECVLNDAGLRAWPKQLAVLEADLREQRENMQDAADEAEMRAAFGPGTTVVNVLTGRRTQL